MKNFEEMSNDELEQLFKEINEGVKKCEMARRYLSELSIVELERVASKYLGSEEIRTWRIDAIIESLIYNEEFISLF